MTTDKILLMDSMFFYPGKYELKETSETINDSKLVKVTGPFSQVDVRNANNRLYPRKVWEKSIKMRSEAMKNRRVFGEVDHPADGITQLKRASHIVTNLEIVENGWIIGTAYIIKDIELGKLLLTMFESNLGVGISSRGKGSLDHDAIVQTDYMFDTFDFVANPSSFGAYPTVESKPSKQNESISGIDEFSTANTTDFMLETKSLKLSSLSLMDYKKIDNKINEHLIKLKENTNIGNKDKIMGELADIKNSLSKYFDRLING